MEAWGKSNLHAHLSPSRKWAESSVLTVRNPNSSGHSGGAPLLPPEAQALRKFFPELLTDSSAGLFPHSLCLRIRSSEPGYL